MSGVEAMIVQAEKTLGVGETNGNNRNYITAWYGLNGEPWCDQAVSYWGAHSGNGAAIGKFAYTVAHADWFRQQGRWHTDIAGIRRGDIVFFDWGLSNSIGAIDHVGIVTSVSGSMVYTIEGNIGNVCARKVRHSDTIAGYGRPAYVESAPAPTPVPVPSPSAKFEPFPGSGFFVDGKKSPIVAAMHARLVAEGCNEYATSTDKDVWGSGDKASYAAWQRKRGFTGRDADGVPGQDSWDALKVPNV